MLPKAHLTSHWLLALGEWPHHCGHSGHQDLFCTTLLCILSPLLISSASVRSLIVLSFIMSILAWNVPLISLIFLMPFSFYCFPLFLCCVYFRRPSYLSFGFPGCSVEKNWPANEEDPGLIPGLGRSPEEANGNPLQYSCLGNPMDIGTWWAMVHEVMRVGQYFPTKQHQQSLHTVK